MKAAFIGSAGMKARPGLFDQSECIIAIIKYNIMSNIYDQTWRPWFRKKTARPRRLFFDFANKAGGQALVMAPFL